MRAKVRTQASPACRGRGARRHACGAAMGSAAPGSARASLRQASTEPCWGARAALRHHAAPGGRSAAQRRPAPSSPAQQHACRLAAACSTQAGRSGAMPCITGGRGAGLQKATFARPQSLPICAQQLTKAPVICPTPVLCSGARSGCGGELQHRMAQGGSAVARSCSRSCLV